MRALLIAVAIALTLLGTSVMAAEEPPFTVELKHGGFEVRAYPPLIVAEVSVRGDRKDAAGKGFRLLAGYIFGDNTRRQKIAMTAPVVQSPGRETIAMTAPVLQTGGEGTWVIRFIMPHGAALDTLPRPNNPKVELHALAAARVAVVQFSGLAREDDVAAQTLALSRFVMAQHLRATGSPSLAQYDPPWKPWFMRRNEMMIPVAPAAGGKMTGLPELPTATFARQDNPAPPSSWRTVSPMERATARRRDARNAEVTQPSSHSTTSR